MSEIMPFHPVANIFPLMTGDEFAALVADIREHGLLEPITVHENTVIDGRNRYNACKEAGIEPRIEQWTGQGSLAQWVISKNLHRRHLNESQRSMVSARLATMQQGARTDIASIEAMSQPVSAELLNVSRPSVQRARHVIENGAPELVAAVDSGKVAVSIAATIADMPEEQQHAIVEKVQSGQAKSAADAKRQVKQAEREATLAAQRTADPLRAAIIQSDAISFINTFEKSSIDLLLTDPPYSTDVDDIGAFVASWLPATLDKIKPTGRAYICIGAYPLELSTYLDYVICDPRFESQVLVWTYRNTMGPTPKDAYKQNWQAILYLRGIESAPLDCPTLIEQFSVQDINAPDGRQGDRYHSWQKPSELAERFVRHASKPGDLVVDPFCGTGTFLLAAASLGRVARGCDCDLDVLAIAEQRGCYVERKTEVAA